MSLQKISAATIIALSLAACSSGSDSPNSTLPNTNPTVTNPSNGNQTNNGNAAAANNQNNPASNGNTAANNGNNPTNSGNTAINNPPPRVDFSVSYEGIKNTANKDIRELAQEKKIKGEVILKSYKVNLGNQSSSGNNFNLSSIPLKTLDSQNYRETVVAQAGGQNHTITRNGVAHIYRQNYSLIAGITPTGLTINGESEKLDADDDDTNILIKGYTTQKLPTTGKFNYSGIASDGVSQGKLAYSVNFDNGKGSGTITGIGSDINLHEASIREGSYTNEIDNTEIKGYGIQGSSNRGDYALGFFGPNAEEIVGTVNDGEIGFAGSH